MKYGFFKFSTSWIARSVGFKSIVFVVVGDKPIRASKKSAEWCLKAVDVCWEKKVSRIREEEKEDARKAYDVAREVYKKIVKESTE